MSASPEVDMELDDIETLRCSLRCEQEGGKVRWTSEQGSIGYEMGDGFWSGPTGFIHGVGLRIGVGGVLLRDVFLERIRSMRYRRVSSQERHVDPAFVRIQDLSRIAQAPRDSILGALRMRNPNPDDLLERTRRASRVPTTLHLGGGPIEAWRVLDDLLVVGRTTVLDKLLLFFETVHRSRSRALRELRDRLVAKLGNLCAPDA